MITTSQRPRTVYCAIENNHRQMSVARDACAGVFTSCGVTLSLSSIDWRRIDVHEDREWWIEWSKFYFGLDLAYAFSTSGDRRYLNTWQALVTSCFDQLPPDFGPTDALARRLQNWLYAWLQFCEAPALAGFANGFEDRLANALVEQAAYLAAHLTPERNHRTLELYTLLLIALALPDLDASGARAAFAWEQLRQNLLTDCRSDGVQREHSTHYHMIALRSWIGARENARRHGLPVDTSYDDRLRHALHFARHIQRPDGSIPMLSDSDSADYRETLALGERLLGEPDDSSARTVVFPAGGYVIQRQTAASGTLARHLVFDCGDVGDGGHGHYDALSIDVWAGAPIVVDPGRYTYAEGTPNLRRWFKSTAAHNTVCVDGLDQTEYAPGKPKGQRASARMLVATDVGHLTVAGGEVRTGLYDAVHRRYVVFVNGDYWLVVDQLHAERPHVYDVRFNLGSDAVGHTAVSANAIHAPAVDVLCAGPGAFVLEEGWVSRTYGRKTPAAVACFRSEPMANAWFVTAILPRDGSRPATLDVRSSGLNLVVRITGRDTAPSDVVITRSATAGDPPIEVRSC